MPEPSYEEKGSADVSEASEDSGIEISEEKSENKTKRRSGMLGKLKSFTEDDILMKYVNKGIETTKKTLIDAPEMKKKKKRKSKKSSSDSGNSGVGLTMGLAKKRPGSFESRDLRCEKSEDSSFSFKYVEGNKDDSFLDSPSTSPRTPGDSDSFSPRKIVNPSPVVNMGRSRTSTNSEEDAANRRAKLLLRYNSVTSTETVLQPEEDPHALRISGSNKKFHKRFKLDDEIVIDDFLCALLLRGTLLAQGSMYITHNYVCFYANIFTKVTRVTIPFQDIISVRKCKILKSIPNSIEVHTINKKYFWASYLHREAAFQLIDQRWRLLRQKMGCPVIDQVRPRSDEDASIDWGNDKVDIGFDWREEDDSDTEDPFLSTTETIPPTSKDCCHEVSGNDTSEPPRYSEKFPISVKDFYLNFLSDGSKEFWTTYHDRSGYVEFKMTPWKSSLERCCLERTVDFVAPIKLTLATKSTRVTQKQRCRFVNDSEIVFETSSHSHDVIKANQFLVDAIWNIKKLPNGSGCELKIHVNVRFTKKNWMNFMIQRTAIEGSRDWFENWIFSALAYAKNLRFDSNVPKAMRSSAGDLLRRSIVIPLPQNSDDTLSQNDTTRTIHSNNRMKLIFGGLLLVVVSLFVATLYFYYQGTTLEDEIFQIQLQNQLLAEQIEKLKNIANIQHDNDMVVLSDGHTEPLSDH